MNFLNSIEIEKELQKKFTVPYFNDWFKIVEPFLVNHEFQKRKLFKHHEYSVWDHCILVSLTAYSYACKFGANKRVCAIGGLLHDFYPLAWQYSDALNNYDARYLERLKRKESLLKKHGFTHAKEAYNNSLLYFEEVNDERIADCIIKHMFPLNISLPRYKESWLVSLSDKVVSVKDMSLKTFVLIFRRR